MGRLENKVAIITGGNSGIGEATARLFAKEGAKVAILARRIKEGNQVTKSINNLGGESIFIKCDVADSYSVENAVQEVVAKFGGLDVLFNNAGGGSVDNFPIESNDSWGQTIAINLTGTFYMCRSAWKYLVDSGSGIIINMSSLAAQRGFSKNMYDLSGAPSASYYAAKAGIDAFTRYIAGVGGHNNIRVNAVRPGQILTAKTDDGKGNHLFKSAFDMLQILKSTGYPEDVANTVLFLASDESRFITGEIINVDGGMPAKL